jgi:hypothetical protein
VTVYILFHAPLSKRRGDDAPADEVVVEHGNATPVKAKSVAFIRTGALAIR